MNNYEPMCIYFSRTGNTKRFAQAIADMAKAPIFDLTSTQPSALADFDMLILGTPVEGASPAKETIAFLEGIPEVKGKNAILVLHLPGFWQRTSHEKN